MIAAIIASIWPYLAAGAAVIAAFAVTYLKGRGDGSAMAETKALKGEIDARDEQLEMQREATKADLDAAALSDEQARKEAMKWAGH